MADEQTTVDNTPETKVTDTLVSEINTAIDASLATKEVEAEPERKVTAEVKEDKPIETVEKVKEEESVVVETKPVERAKLSNAAITRAVRAGLSLEDAQAFQSDASLERVAASIEASRRPVEVAEETTEDEDLFSSLPVLNPDDYEADVIKMYEGLTAVMKKQQETIKELQNRTEQSTRVSRDASSRDTEKWFDDQVSNLGDEFKDSLGSGRYNELDRSSPQFLKRDALANQCAVLIAGYRASGQQLPPRDEIFSQAASVVLKDTYLKAHEKKLSSELAERKNQHIARAGSSKGKSKGDTAADVAAMLDEKFFGKA